MHLYLKWYVTNLSISPFGHPSTVPRANSPLSRQQRRAALVPTKKSTMLLLPSADRLLLLLLLLLHLLLLPVNISSACLSLPLAPQHLSPPRRPPLFFFPLYVPFFIYFFDISVRTPPPPSQLQIVESRKHTHTVMHACSTENIKICASWHSTERETHTVTQWRWCLIGGLLESSANKRRWSPPGRLPLRLKLPMKLWHVQEESFTAAIYTVTEGTHHAAIHRRITEDPPADAAQNIQGDVVPPCVRGGSLLSEAASNFLFSESIQTVSTIS